MTPEWLEYLIEFVMEVDTGSVFGATTQQSLVTMVVAT